MNALAGAVRRQIEPPPSAAFRAGSEPSVQLASLRVSAPGDPAEREASAVARAIVNLPAPATAATRRSEPANVLRAAPAPFVRHRPGVIARSATLAPASDGAALAARIAASRTGGTPLPAPLRRFMEPRFGADFADVRVHADANAATLSRQLAAQAFASGRHIFFARGEFQPETAAGRELIAHELAHTIQQGAVARAPVADAQRQPDLALGAQPADVIQRLGLPDIVDGLAELAANVPGFTLLTLIIGRNPITMRAVERNAINVLRAFMGLIPGGEILFQVLDRYGVISRLGAWALQQSAALGLSLAGVRDAFTRFTDGLGWRDIFSPRDVWRRAQAVFTPLLTRLANLVSGLVAQAITWLKETFMAPLANFCREIPGYGLVSVMLGRDPFTAVPVPRTALTVVRAFAEFIPGGTEKVNQLVESRALERAYAWFTQETRARDLTWARVTGTFAEAWAGLRLADVLQPIDTLRRMIALFRPLLGDLVSFAGAALIKLLELIFEAVMGAGGARILAILKRARATFNIIINDPVAFLRNLLGAVGQGVRQFMTNILRHLRDGVIAWLTGPVAAAGIRMPERWDLRGIIGFVLQILGLTWARVREKLVRLIGERALGMLEAGFQLLLDIRDRGLVVALRERVSEFFGALRDAALGAIRSFIQQRLVQAGITQLLSLLSPVGAVIQAIIKTYTTIQFFIQRINQILDLVESVVNSIAAIASGAIAAAADFIERTMARTIPVILDFLARFIGLGDVGAQVTTTIRNLQASVDRMLDRAVDWIRRQASALASRALGGDPNATPQQRLQNGLREGTQAVNRLSGSRIGLAVIRPVLAVIRVRHGMQRLDAEPRGTRWTVVGVVNPSAEELTQKLVDTTTAGATQRTYEPVNGAGFGTRATVSGLNAIGNQNSPTAEGNRTWDHLRKRLFRAGAASYYYVRGHLINGTFGGPGNDWRNMTPLTQTANNRSIASMLSTFENPVRDAVRAGGTADITVTAQYRVLGRAAIAASVRSTPSLLPGRSPEERRAIADLIVAEESLPSAVVATATVRTSSGNRTLPPSTTQNVIDTELSRYYHNDYPPASGATARRDVNLNDALPPVLMTLTGVDAATAARIVQRRAGARYRDRDDFIARLGATGTTTWHAMSSTAGARLVF